MASDDSVLPANTKEKCSYLKELDQNKSIKAPTIKVEEVNNTDHQFDYKENNEQAVKDTINKIINIFKSM